MALSLVQAKSLLSGIVGKNTTRYLGLSSTEPQPVSSGTLPSTGVAFTNYNITEPTTATSYTRIQISSSEFANDATGEYLGATYVTTIKNSKEIHFTEAIQDWGFYKYFFITTTAASRSYPTDSVVYVGELIYDKFIERCGGPCFNAVDFAAFEHQHSVIFELLSVDSYVRDMEIMSELSKLLTMIMKQCWQNSTECKVGSSAKKWIPVKKYIDENYCQSISLEELSEKFTINKFYLTRKFKEEYGCTIYQYITNLRITASKELLRFTDYNVTEVAMKLGFSDSAYFTRVFSNSVGISPLKFKKQWNVKNG